MCGRVTKGGWANRAKTTTRRRFAHNTAKTLQNYTNMVCDAAFYCSSAIHGKKKMFVWNSDKLTLAYNSFKARRHRGVELVFKSARWEAWASAVCHHKNQQKKPSTLTPLPDPLRTSLLFPPPLWYDTFSGGVHLKGFLGFLDLERDAAMAWVWRTRGSEQALITNKAEVIISPEPWRHSLTRTPQFNPNSPRIKSLKGWILLLVKCQVCSHQEGETLHSQYRCLMKGTLYRIIST